MIVTPTHTMRALRPPTNDERRAAWAARYYRAGLHRKPELTTTKKEPTPCDRKP